MRYEDCLRKKATERLDWRYIVLLIAVDSVLALVFIFCLFMLFGQMNFNETVEFVKVLFSN